MRDFFDNWARFFGYDYWAWGSFADMLGALGTAGAFFFGFWLLARDSAEKRRKDADAFITDTTFVIRPVEQTRHMFLDVSNVGEHTITGAAVYEWAEGGPNAVQVLGEYVNFRWRFPPGHAEQKSIKVNRNSGETKLLIEFVDATGRKWFRSLDTGRYMSRRQYNKTYWGTCWGLEPDRAKIRQKAGKLAFQPATKEDEARIVNPSDKDARVADHKTNPTVGPESE
ncbi:hypothetical protein [Marisediminicola sp. LYQ85]|uniref:hypothetical protein n=1 Tax=Marisediminicola sp. LYQ85 TaxID=3391062 RepID=UPI003982DCD3